ncbi:perlucin-like [Crassostrea virginica]|uniref:Perlucin-like n=1 Tax=Crassostrea virginica TaxID=6565 RepID=A0A8B8BEG3_CRAVI|nr:perlucin-like [Crassostrea virginica]XP_022302844.1 perlucin-like [Crassostrea virginica]
MILLNYILSLSVVLLHIEECTSQEQCPEGFFQHDNSCYFFSSHLLADWIEAGTFCKRFQGGDLVAIESQSENNFIYQQLLLMHDHYDYWIGGTDEFVEGHWVWISTMQKLSFTDWSPGGPSDSGSNEDCMEIIVGHGAPATWWNDDVCSKKANFICEVPLMEGTVIG